MHVILELTDTHESYASHVTQLTNRENMNDICKDIRGSQYKDFS